MPSSPGKICRDCCSRALEGTDYCAVHTGRSLAYEYGKLYDRYRKDDPIRALYKTARWNRTRRIVFSRDVLCKSCGHKASKECDHAPLEARQIVEQFGVAEFFNPDRCQGLCHDCHSHKTATTVGFAKPKSERTVEQ